MQNPPRYIVFAGVNGAGKSTLYHSEMWADESNDLNLPRVNPDEIIRENGWNWAKSADQVAAGRIALARIEEFFGESSSFNQETTLAGQLAVKNIKRAAQAGYDVHIKYVGVEAPDIAIARIKHRAEIGGHDIDAGLVARRYATSIRNLETVFPYCKTVSFFDNSSALNLVALADQETIYDFYPRWPKEAWYKTILTDLKEILQP